VALLDLGRSQGDAHPTVDTVLHRASDVLRDVEEVLLETLALARACRPL
jgi:hypothetical protein